MEDPVEDIENLETYKKALKENAKSVVHFYATWAPPCDYMAKIMIKMKEFFPDIKFIKVDVDKGEDICKEVNVNLMPTFLFYEGEEKKDQFTGAYEDKLQGILSKMSPNSKGAEDYKNPDNFIILNEKEEYDKIISNNKLTVFAFYVDWSFPCRRMTPVLRRDAKEYSKINFVKIDGDKFNELAKKENVECYPSFVVYKNGKFNSRFEGGNELLLKSRLDEYNGINDNAEIINSKNHIEHPLKKVKRINAKCNICQEDYDGEYEMGFCIECQFNICMNCKRIEDGLEPEFKYYEFIKVLDKNGLDEYLNKYDKVVCFFYPKDYPVKRSFLEMFSKEYDNLKYIKIGETDKSKELFEKYKIEDPILKCFNKNSNEEEPKSIEFKSPYNINTELFKFSEKEIKEKFTSKKHEHELLKMNHIGYNCDICKKTGASDKMTPIYRCIECGFDFCLDCYEKEINDKNNNDDNENDNNDN